MHVKTVHAGGLIATNGYPQVIPAEDRALIVFDGKTETIFTSITFTINPQVAWNFVYLVAVPGKPEVELLSHDLFVDLEKATQKSFDHYPWWQKILFPERLEEDALPAVVFSRAIDFVRFGVFAPDETEKLSAWLLDMGYYIPKSAGGKLAEYGQKQWYFVGAEVNALHIEYESTDSLTVHGAHTLPLKITFPTDTLIYPSKLASFPPDTDSAAIPHSFAYGTRSELVLGETSDPVDRALAYQSKNKFPNVPIDYTPVKQELFVIADRKVTAPTMTTTYARPIDAKTFRLTDAKGNIIVPLPPGRLFLTRLYMYKPTVQLDDVVLQKINNTTLVNVPVTAKNLITRIASILAFGLAASLVWKKFTL